MRHWMLCAFAAVSCVSFVPAAPPTPGSGSAGAPRGEVNMDRAMQMRVPAVEFSGVPIDDIFSFMRDVANLNLYVNWPALEAVGIDRSTPIQLKLRNIRMGKVLDLALNQASAGGVPLTWYVSDNIVYITTKQIADQDMVTRIYPIQDLLLQIPNYRPPTFTPSQGGSGGGGGSPFGTSEDNDRFDENATEEMGQKIVELIMTLIEPEVWVENGGFSRIRYFRGTLIVTAPRSVQRQIGR